MPDIFISYARSDEHADRVTATAIRDRLTSIGLQVYTDVELLPGGEYEKELKRQIESARLVLALWSVHSLDRTFVLGECELAQELNKLTPILLEPEAKAAIPLSLKKLHFQAFDPSSQESWNDLITMLATKLNMPELVTRFNLSIKPLLAESTSAEAMSVEVVLAHLRRSKITIPDYQRDGGEWNSESKSIFLESIINNLAIPALFFEPRTLEGNREINEVVDGQQRLSTLQEFYEDRFVMLPAEKTNYISLNSIYYAGKRFSELPESFKEAFLSHRLSIITLRNVGSMRLEIFRRINRGGARLSAHDIRLAYYSDQSPTVTFIKIAGTYDPNRDSSIRFLNSANEKFGLRNPWADPISSSLWKDWWEGKEITRGQTPSAMFLLALTAAQFTRLGKILSNAQSLAELNINARKSLDDALNVYCARTQLEDSNTPIERALFDVQFLKDSFFPHFEYTFARIQRGNKTIPLSEYKFLATLIGALFRVKRAPDIRSFEWNRIVEFALDPGSVARSVGVVWRSTDGNWSGPSGWRGRMQAMNTVFEKTLGINSGGEH